MNRSLKYTLIILIPVLLIVMGIIYFRREYIPKYRWDQNYSYKSDQPYGLKLMYDILSESRTKNNFVRISKDPGKFLNGKDSTSLYLFVGYQYIISEETANKLADFVARGNTAFISNITTEHTLFDYLTENKHSTLFLHRLEDSVVRVAFSSHYPDSVFNFHFQSGKAKAIYTWLALDSVTIADSLSYYGFEKVTSFSNGDVDCFRVKHGKGTFIFHFNPLFFTNYHLSNKDGLRFVNAMLSGYRANRIYWDEYSKVPISASSGSGNNMQTPFRFILSEQSLRWAWYLLCFFILLYLIINAKRRQARMPLIPENKNTTTEYLNSLATLHYHANSLGYISEEMMRQFYTFIKSKYNISPSAEKEEMLRLLILRSGIPSSDVKKIFNYHRALKYDENPEKETLIKLYKATEYFYKNCK